MQKYREFICLECGEKAIDRSFNGCGKFCSQNCTAAHYYRSKHPDAKKPNLCLFNKWVVCEERNCVSCGWNPAVAKMRKEALLCQEATG